MKKFEFTGDETKTIYDRKNRPHVSRRIRSLIDIPNGLGGYIVRAGELGGFLEFYDNLSQEGNSWVGNEACVYGASRVYGDGLVRHHARVEDSVVCEDGVVEKYATVERYSYILTRGVATDHAIVTQNSWVINRTVGGYSFVSGER